MKYKKWRELSVDLKNINYKNIDFLKEENYMPAGNDVVEAKVKTNDKIENVFIKYERSNITDLENEKNALSILTNKIKEIPKVIEYGTYNGKAYLITEKLKGKKLSEIFSKKGINKGKYLLNYGEKLASIHKLEKEPFKISLKRKINDYPKDETKFDEYAKRVVEYLKLNEIKKDNNTFIHGDFHYGNVLFRYGKVSGILDFEYSGRGFKEQDIAWACILRPTGNFMDTKEDINYFLEGYKKIGSFDYEKFKWCYINASIHFYLMNMNNKEYQEKLKKLIDYMLNQ